jgi:hypothetical protein
MARGGARPGAGRPAGKSANTSPLSRVRAPAREAARKIKGRGRRTRSLSQTGDLWLLGAKVTCPKCHKVTPIERAIKR